VTGSSPSSSSSSSEAALLLGYVMAASGTAWRPGQAERERYAAALRAQVPGTHELDPIVHRFPVLLGGLDALCRIRYPRSVLQQKLIVAAALVEADPVSAPWLLPRDRTLARWGLELVRLGLRVAGKWCLALPLLLCPGFVRRNAGTI
jgi:hypothetical protein